MKGMRLAETAAPKTWRISSAPPAAPLPRRVQAQLLTRQAGDSAPEHFRVHILDYGRCRAAAPSSPRSWGCGGTNRCGGFLQGTGFICCLQHNICARCFFYHLCPVRYHACKTSSSQKLEPSSTQKGPKEIPQWGGTACPQHPAAPRASSTHHTCCKPVTT